jgi:uncharacterized SAM-binding protein YcdF (DUF218 family)
LFYFVSKIFNFFLAPENWIYILLVIALLVKSGIAKRRILISCAIIFLVFSNEALFNKIANSWQSAPMSLQDSAGYSAGILLGGFTMTDKHDQMFLSEASDRFVQTLLLYKRGIIRKIIVTGTNNPRKKITEAAYLQKLFVQAGVPVQDVLVELHAKNTAENVSFSKRLIDSIQATPPYVVITSAFHTRRAAKVFEKAGMPVIMYPCAYIAVCKPLEWDDYLLPKMEIMFKWRYILKEYFGVIAYRLTGRA